MSIGYWDQVQKAGFEVPSDRPLDELTAELTAMLGSTRPEVRDGTAYPALATWIANGVYDDLLAGLGDGMVAGLSVGIGEDGTDTVFRRSFSALILGACIERDNEQHLLPGAKILEWGDRAATWFLTERDTRGYVDEKGWAHTVAHGADTLGALGESPHLAGPEHTVLLDIAGRAPARPAGRGSAGRRRARPHRRRGDADPAAQHARRRRRSSRGCTASVPRRTPSTGRSTTTPTRSPRRRRRSSARSSCTSRWVTSRPPCGPTCSSS